MRIPVFGRGANPRIDPPILRKSESYAALQVAAGRADWISPDDHSQGILCRELIYFGPRAIQVETVSMSYLCSGELPGIRFIPPRTEKNPTLPHLESNTLLAAAPYWDWSAEPAPAF
jgi:hypothetical protein